MTDDGIQSGSAAMELVQQGEAIMKMENETLLKVALQRPRDEQKVLDGALKELELVPEEAATAYYAIPFKTPDGQTQLVEGPSIKAAMSLARRWGNCSVGARVLSEDATGINVEGVFLDYETSFRVLRPQRVSRFIKRRNGSTMELSADRLQMATQAGASKALRNAILAGLPAYLVNSFFKKAKTIVAGGKLDERPTPAEIDKAVRGFAPWNVTAEQLEKNVELQRSSWTRETIATLRGLYTALKDGQTTVEEAFGVTAPAGGEEKPAEAPKASGSKLDALADALPTTAEADPAVAVPARTEGPGDPNDGDPRPALIRALVQALGTLARQPTEAQWNKITKHFCKTTVLDTADPSLLEELLKWVREYGEGNKAAVAKLGRILGE